MREVPPVAAHASRPGLTLNERDIGTGFAIRGHGNVLHFLCEKNALHFRATDRFCRVSNSVSHITLRAISIKIKITHEKPLLADVHRTHLIQLVSQSSAVRDPMITASQPELGSTGTIYFPIIMGLAAQTLPNDEPQFLSKHLLTQSAANRTGQLVH